MKNEIRNLEQLQKEKQKLKLQMEVTQHALFKSLNKSQRLLRGFVWSRVALPATVVGLTAKGVQYWLADDEKESAVAQHSNGNGQHWLQKAIPVVLSLVKAWSDTQNGTSEET